VAWYLQGIQPDSVFRQTFNAINEPKEQLIVLEGFLNSILDKEKC
jgi:tRNA-dihydrouridine synthase B